MKARVRAKSLTLVNWRGIFFRTLDFDRHVTALEGANGAGKTTVMIAAYTVLLPDMTRLRFTNLGESASTRGDRGIWGRLGEPGRPAFAAIEFDLPRQGNVIAGVMLMRKGEPVVELTPFIIRDRPAAVTIQDLFLLRSTNRDGELDESVPLLEELAQNVALFGCELEVFKSTSSYFAALFNLGITPLKLSGTKERNKYNEMLRTSMTGGMSRGLLTELRAFLLKEEDGLANSLSTMNNNLEACRSTRAEVRENQRIEREVSRVYEAGEGMFYAAMASLAQRARDGHAKIDEALQRRADLDQEVMRTTAAFEAASESFERAKANRHALNEKLRLAREQEPAMRDALRLSRRVRSQKESRVLLEQEARAKATLADQARQNLELTEHTYESAEVSLTTARAALSNWSEGLDDLYRQAAAYKRIARTVAQITSALELEQLELSALNRLLEDTRASHEQVDARRREQVRRLADVESHRQEYALAREHFRALDAAFPGEEERLLHIDPARALVREVRTRREQVERIPKIERELVELRSKLSRQHKAHTLLAALGSTPKLDSSASVSDELERVADEIREWQAVVVNATRAADNARHDIARGRERATGLEMRSMRFEQCEAWQRELSHALERAEISSKESLLEVRATLREKITHLRAEIDNCIQRAREHESIESSLLEQGGTYPEALVHTARSLNGTLLGTHFDDVSPEEAAVIEARLGPLSNAIVVDDLEAATGAAATRPASLETVWLVEQDADMLAASPSVLTDDVVVDEPFGRRITRLPDRPVLGQRARAARALEHASAANSLHSRAESSRESLATLQRLEGVCDEFLEHVTEWMEGSPKEALRETRALIDTWEKARRDALQEAEDTRAQIKVLDGRRKLLLGLLPDASLLAEEDLDARCSRKEEVLSSLKRDARALRTVRDADSDLERVLHALTKPPLDEEAEAALRAEIETSISRSDALNAVCEQLQYVLEHRDDLAFHQAEILLASKKEIQPEFQARVDEARAAHVRAREGLLSAREGEREARHASESASHALERLRVALGEDREALEATGFVNVTAESLQAHREQITSTEERLEELDKLQLEAHGKLHDASNENTRVEDALERAIEHTSEVLAQEQPHIDAWRQLEQEASSYGLLQTMRAVECMASHEERSASKSLNLATQQRATLLAYLDTANDAALLRAKLRESSGEHTQSSSIWLSQWLDVRRWLARRLPANITQEDDPLRALERLRDKLSVLEERLEKQELRLRGKSANIAQGIRTLIRRARRNVRQLAHHLNSVSFGSIASINLKMEDDERMSRVLEAFETQAAQQLLFHREMPFEEALDELFRRHGGILGKQSILDYREYIRLEVEIKRFNQTEWEPANPTRLSTGEAIGVGAALMMVILTEWENSTKFIHASKRTGTMRFLFLDEANRLDHANLSTLFSLCSSLDLQLLLAAPEVARADDCAVFRLVRIQDDHGRERVVFSGRHIRQEDVTP